MTDAEDRVRVRRASTAVGVWVAAASAVIIASGVGILVAVILVTSRPERGEVGRGQDHDGDHVVVDVDRVVPWIIVLGIVGVLLLALVAWLAASRSVRPLAEALQAQRNFVSDASHELRTPLTALTSRIQIVQRRHTRGESLDETIADLRRNAATMDDVLTDLLLSAEGDAAGPAEPSDVRRGLESAVQALTPLADDANVAIEVAAGKELRASIPSVTLTRLCVALVDNAIQHAPPGSGIRVSAVVAGRSVQIRVSDHGPGIREADAERIFERFARAGETGRRRGFGLGLALVRDVATRYGGTVAVETTSPQGTTFLLVLPSA
ncbi:sensor histidine kinase [Microbacterium sp. P5_E9]